MSRSDIPDGAMESERIVQSAANRERGDPSNVPSAVPTPPWTAGQRLAKLREEIARCVKCGQCRSICPVFLESGDEGMVARGRLSLAEAILNEEIPFSKKSEQYFQSCIKCLRCGTICPTGVAYEAAIQGIRAQLAEVRGVPWYAKLAFRYLLPHRALFNLALETAARLQRLVPMRRRGAMRHLPLFFMGRRWIPSLAKKSSLKRHRTVRPVANARGRVAFFTGCLINHIYTDVADSVVNVLNRAGFEVIVPRDQLCCGTPVMSFGDMEAAARLAVRNLEVFRRLDVSHIVVACASCCRTLRTDYPELLGERWKREVPPVMSFSEFLAEQGGLDFEKLPRTATYHDPCHLNWGLGITRQPRELLAQSAAFVEMTDADRCCGNGGAFSVYHYDLSIKISAHKIEALRESAAEWLVTECPGCMLQFADRIAESGMDVEVLHLAQVVDRATATREENKNQASQVNRRKVAIHR